MAAWRGLVLSRSVLERSRRSPHKMRYALITGLVTAAYAGLVLLATQVFAFHTPWPPPR